MLITMLHLCYINWLNVRNQQTYTGLILGREEKIVVCMEFNIRKNDCCSRNYMLSEYSCAKFRTEKFIIIFVMILFTWCRYKDGVA